MTKTQKNWSNNIFRMEFFISEDSPICVLHQKWDSQQPPLYDMHYGLELGILLSGKMTRFNRDSKQNISTGQVWFCGMWEPHGYQIHSKNTEAVVLIIFPPVLARTELDRAHPIKWLAPFEASPQDRPQTNSKTKNRITELANELHNITRQTSQHTNAWLRIKLHEILLVLLEKWELPTNTAPQTSDELSIVNRAIEMVFANSTGITTQQAAEKCSMNRNSFAKLFSNIMGIKFSEFNLRFRTTKAADMLRKTNTPIKKIASDCGFSDVPHLHKIFVKYYNQTPKEFRNAIQ